MRQVVTKGLMAAAMLYGVAFIVHIAAIAPAVVRADAFWHLGRIFDFERRADYGGFLRYLFEIQSGHVAVPYKLLTLFNYIVFDYSTRVSIVIAVLIVLAYWLSVVRYTWITLPAGLGRPIAVLLATLVMLNPNGHEAYTWPDSVPSIYTTGFGSLIVLLWWSRLITGTAPAAPPQKAGLLTVAALTVLSSGAGIVLLPAAAFYLWLERDRPAVTAAMARGHLPLMVVAGLLVLALVAAVAWIGPGTIKAYLTTHAHMDETFANLAAVAARPSRFLAFFLATLASPVSILPVDTVWPLGLGFALWFVFLCRATARDDSLRAARPWLALALSGVLVALMIALTRHDYSLAIDGSVQSRYAPYVLPFYLGLIPASCLLLSTPTGAPGRNRLIAVAATGLLVAGVVAAVPSVIRGQASSLSRTAEILVAQEGTANRSIQMAVRLTSAPTALGSIYVDLLPALKARGLAASLTDRFVADARGFVAAHGIEMPIPRRLWPQSALSQVCSPRGDGAVAHLRLDDRYGLAGRPPHRPFIRFVGHARNVRDCDAPVDFVFAADRDGKVLCVSRTMPYLHHDLPEAAKRRYAPSPHLFDFSCPVSGDPAAGAPYTVYSYSAAVGLSRLN